jgi:hypothetical protein
MEGSMFPGMKNGYVLYRVDTHDPNGRDVRSVRRRFRDFVVRPCTPAIRCDAQITSQVSGSQQCA